MSARSVPHKVGFKEGHNSSFGAVTYNSQRIPCGFCLVAMVLPGDSVSAAGAAGRFNSKNTLILQRVKRDNPQVNLWALFRFLSREKPAGHTGPFYLDL